MGLVSSHSREHIVDTLTLTDAEFAVEIENMRQADADAGKSSASWLVDGNTSEDTCRAILKQFDDGDPAAPSAPSPFSGEWAGDPTIEDVITDVCSVDFDSLEPEEVDELATAYEDAFYSAWQDEAERSVRASIGE